MGPRLDPLFTMAFMATVAAAAGGCGGATPRPVMLPPEYEESAPSPVPASSAPPPAAPAAVAPAVVPPGVAP